MQILALFAALTGNPTFGAPVGAAPASTALVVPRGRAVLLDGRADAAEWADAATVSLSNGGRLLIKRDSAYVYVAVTVPAPRVFGVNLYLAPADTVGPYLNLHASAKLGERTGRGGGWPAWHWWNNVGWTANVARFNAFDGQRFLPDVAKEFQIALARWPGAAFRLSLDLESAHGTEQPLSTRVRVDGLHWVSGRLRE
jgi:hypothetical protein